MILCFFFFKQKTAYEMRISDWSSDVCSSDLLDGAAPDALRAAAALGCVEAEPVGGHLRPGLAVELHPRVEPLHRLRIDASGQALQRRQPARRAAREVAAIQVHRLVLGEVVAAVLEPDQPQLRDPRLRAVPGYDYTGTRQVKAQ